MNSKSGFTLIEIMVVVIIIAALAGMVLPHLMDKPDQAKADIARADIRSINTALKLFKLDTGKYPAGDDGLKSLIKKPPSSVDNWRGPYLEKEPNDPWKNPYQYKNPGSRGVIGVDVFSTGPDGQLGTDDDVWPDE